MKVIFRDLNPAVVAAVAQALPEWDAAVGNILTAGPAGAIVSPANCIGRMDGGIDQAYINHFGWRLQAALCWILVDRHGGRLEVGEAVSVPTGLHSDIPLMISAPTMDWPPGDVSTTDNAYKAFNAVLHVAKALNLQSLLCPGLCTLTGRMEPAVFAAQVRRAWDEHQMTAIENR